MRVPRLVDQNTGFSSTHMLEIEQYLQRYAHSTVDDCYFSFLLIISYSQYLREETAQHLKKQGFGVDVGTEMTPPTSERRKLHGDEDADKPAYTILARVAQIVGK